jgi:hypothetical protein
MLTGTTRYRSGGESVLLYNGAVRTGSPQGYVQTLHGLRRE